MMSRSNWFEYACRHCICVWSVCGHSFTNVYCCVFHRRILYTKHLVSRKNCIFSGKFLQISQICWGKGKGKSKDKDKGYLALKPGDVPWDFGTRSTSSPRQGASGSRSEASLRGQHWRLWEKLETVESSGRIATDLYDHFLVILFSAMISQSPWCTTLVQVVICACETSWVPESLIASLYCTLTSCWSPSSRLHVTKIRFVSMGVHFVPTIRWCAWRRYPCLFWAGQEGGWSEVCMVV